MTALTAGQWLDILPWLLWAALGFIIVADNIVQAARQHKGKQQLSTETRTEPGPHAEITKTQQPKKHPASPDAAGILRKS